MWPPVQTPIEYHQIADRPAGWCRHQYVLPDGTQWPVEECPLCHRPWDLACDSEYLSLQGEVPAGAITALDEACYEAQETVLGALLCLRCEVYKAEWDNG